MSYLLLMKKTGTNIWKTPSTHPSFNKKGTNPVRTGSWHQMLPKYPI